MIGLTQTIHRLAQINPEGTATTCAGRRKNWTEVRDRIAQFAGALKEIGAREGIRVAILALNSDRYFECLYAIPWAGAEVVPMNIRWSVKEHIFSMEDSGAETLIFDDAFAVMALEIFAEVPGLKNLIYIGDQQAPEGTLDYETIVAAASAADDAGRRGEDVAGIFYTGGTTGFPKGVILPHRGLWASAMCLLPELGFDRDTVYLHAAPMFHLADIGVSNSACLGGGAHIFIPAFDPEGVLKLIEEEKVTDAVLVPAMIKMLLDHPSTADADLTSLKQVTYGASPMPEATLLRAMELLPQCDFVQVYGQTELSPLATVLTREHHKPGGPKLRSAGRAGIGIDLKIVDGDGQEVPPGEVGEIIVRGPNTMLGYLNQPEQTEATLRDGWVFTGDAAWMDEEGFVFIADRVKDMIISGGENVFSAEVENAVSSHPAVQDVAVIGIPDDQWGEAVHAIVILQSGVIADEKDIIDHCKEQIAGYKCPRSVVFRSNPLPLSGAGKVLKTELREPYWEGRERQVN